MSPLSPDPASHTCPDCRHRCTRFTNHILTRLARLWYLPSTVLMMTSRQGLTLVHLSAQREHFMSHVLGCFAGFSDRNGSG